MSAEEKETLNRLAEAVLASPKYQAISPDFIRSIGRRELEKRRSLKEAVKATKNKLHQVAGAYLERVPNYGAWLDELRQAMATGDQAQLQALYKQMMSSHSSTRERLGILDAFYATVLADIRPPGSVIDIACGLNPLALPWMSLPAGVEYTALDIYHDMIDFLNGFFRLAGVKGSAQVADVIEFCPDRQFDLALILKTIPCLEQVDRSAGMRLLENIKANTLLVSFPVHSLGGKGKGMVANYESRFYELLAGKAWTVRRYEFPTELAFLVQK